MKRHLIAIMLASALSIAIAEGPEWWVKRKVISSVVNKEPDDYAALNCGQLKNFAHGAFLEMESNLAINGGAGDEIKAMISGWNTVSATTDDYAVATLGQLKNVAGMFYRRLHEVGQLPVLPLWVNTRVSDDNAVANIGQAKSLFDFYVRKVVAGTNQSTESLVQALQSAKQTVGAGSLGAPPQDSPTPNAGSATLEDLADPANYKLSLEGYEQFGWASINAVPREDGDDTPASEMRETTSINISFEHSVSYTSDGTHNQGSQNAFMTTIENRRVYIEPPINRTGTPPIKVIVEEDRHGKGQMHRRASSSFSLAPLYSTYSNFDYSVNLTDGDDDKFVESAELHYSHSNSPESVWDPNISGSDNVEHEYTFPSAFLGAIKNQGLAPGLSLPGRGWPGAGSYQISDKPIVPPKKAVDPNTPIKPGPPARKPKVDPNYLTHSYYLITPKLDSKGKQMWATPKGGIYAPAFNCERCGEFEYKRVYEDITADLALSEAFADAYANSSNPAYETISAFMVDGNMAASVKVAFFRISARYQGPGTSPAGAVAGPPMTAVLRRDVFVGDDYLTGIPTSTTYSTVIVQGGVINDTLEPVAFFQNGDPLSGKGVPREVRLSLVSPNLLPVEVRDGDRVLTSLPLNEDPWTNANLQKQVADSSIAWITGNTGFADTPEMPKLNARISGGAASMNVRWRFECEYKRGNGYRQGYVADFTRPEDKVGIPYRHGGGYTEDMPASQEWKIYEHSKWTQELSENGFFGGLAKVFMKLDNQPEMEVCRFRIGGKNPDESSAKSYINSQAGATYWYAYAVAKHETFGRVPGRFYNQFYTDHQPTGGRIGDNANDMGWAAWAKAWPLYNLDRSYSSANGYRQNGPGGYGMFQLTLGPKTPGGDESYEGFITRAQIWNWQENCNRAVTELQGKLTKAINLETGLEGGNPTWPQVDAATYGRLNGREAIVLTYYNGMFGGELERVKTTNGRSLSCWKPIGTTNRTWRFLQNINDYVQHVNSHIE